MCTSPPKFFPHCPDHFVLQQCAAGDQPPIPSSNAPGLECWTGQPQKSQVQGHTPCAAATPGNQTLKFFHFSSKIIVKGNVFWEYTEKQKHKMEVLLTQAIVFLDIYPKAKNRDRTRDRMSITALFPILYIQSCKQMSE